MMHNNNGVGECVSDPSWAKRMRRAKCVHAQWGSHKALGYGLGYGCRSRSAQGVSVLGAHACMITSVECACASIPKACARLAHHECAPPVRMRIMNADAQVII